MHTSVWKPALPPGSKINPVTSMSLKEMLKFYKSSFVYTWLHII